jgi:hypothetical protein
MHDSDIFQWMKPDAAAFRLTGFPANAGTSKEKIGKSEAQAEPFAARMYSA